MKARFPPQHRRLRPKGPFREERCVLLEKWCVDVIGMRAELSANLKTRFELLCVPAVAGEEKAESSRGMSPDLASSSSATEARDSFVELLAVGGGTTPRFSMRGAPRKKQRRVDTLLPSLVSEEGGSRRKDEDEDVSDDASSSSSSSSSEVMLAARRIVAQVEAEFEARDLETFAVGGDVEGTVERFVKGEDGDEAAALARTRESLRWRARERVSEILGDALDPAVIATIRTQIPSALLGYNHRGDLVYVERTGQVRFTSLMKTIAVEDLIRYHVLSLEFQNRVLMGRTVPGEWAAWGVNEANLPPRAGPSSSTTRTDDGKTHHHLRGVVTVIDMSGLSVRSVNAKSLATLKTIAAMDAAHYPENLEALHVVNAPAVFAVTWNIIRTFLDPATARKVHIFGSTKADYLETVLRDVGAALLPKDLGGENATTCSDGNSTHPSHVFMDAYMAQMQDQRTSSSTPPTTTTTTITDVKTPTSTPPFHVGADDEDDDDPETNTLLLDESPPPPPPLDASGGLLDSSSPELASKRRWSRLSPPQRIPLCTVGSMEYNDDDARQTATNHDARAAAADDDAPVLRDAPQKNEAPPPLRDLPQKNDASAVVTTAKAPTTKRPLVLLAVLLLVATGTLVATALAFFSVRATAASPTTM